MMKYFVAFRADGTVKQVGRAVTVPAGAFELAIPVGAIDITKMSNLSAMANLMMPDWPLDPLPDAINLGDMVARPAAPAVVEAAGTYTIADCPVDTVVEVHDLIGEERMMLYTTAVEGEDVSFSLPDAGEYEVTVTPPLPSLSRSERIVVT